MLRHAYLLGLFVVRVGYRASLRRFAFGRKLARLGQAAGLYSPAEIQLATQAADALYRRRLRRTRAGAALARLALGAGSLSAGDVRLARTAAAALEEPAAAAPGPYVPPAGLFPWFTPLNCACDPALALAPRVNVLLPRLQLAGLSGGTNTALVIAQGLARSGLDVRLVSCDAPADADRAALLEHVARLTGTHGGLERIEIADASDRSAALRIGPCDVFFATAWWTAQMAKYATQLTRHERFVYLIQDFEPLLDAASSSHALALETYGLPHIPVINTSLLQEHLARERIGRYAERGFVDAALVFEPAIDRTRFHPEAGAAPGRPRELLFYARPQSGQRNLFEIGVAALRMVAAEGLLEPQRWQVHGIGDPFAPVPLGGGAVLRALAWQDYDAYASRMRQADLLLSLMLSPHPSYPPLEMAACGKPVVTNSYGCKTAQALAAISPNLVAAPPTIEGIAQALRTALRRVEAGLPGSSECRLPANWGESLDPVVARLAEQIRRVRDGADGARADFRQELPAPRNAYERFRAQRIAARRALPAPPEGPEIALLTPVYDTPAAYLEELAASVLLQDGGGSFEWVILDNGSTDAATRDVLARIARRPGVRLERVEANVGIVGGMRKCLERASARYVVPLDSDDLLAPDCLYALRRALAAHPEAALLYTDEDKVAADGFVEPYFKPDWDPVLFANSCYIAHLCCIDRRRALELGAYTDAAAEGCHDWDTFIRFLLAGHAPVHIAEVLYSWRTHAGSTSSNIGSKPFVADSHRRVLGKLRASLPQPERFEVVPSPLFAGTPDWWFRRIEASLPQVATLVPAGALHDLEAAVAALPAGIEFVHLCREGVAPEGEAWRAEAIGLFERFPDAAIVGGLLHDGARVVAGPLVPGFGAACDAPWRGQPLEDEGYFALPRKQHSACAVSSAHCVVRRSFLADALQALRAEPASLDWIGPWLGAVAQRRGARVIYSPFLRARGAQAPETRASRAEICAYLDVCADLIPGTTGYPAALSLAADSPWAAALPARRTSQLRELWARADDYPGWLALQLEGRGGRFPVPGRAPSLCILTTAHPGADAELLRATAESLRQQAFPFTRWVIVAHGAIGTALSQVLEAIAADTRIVVERIAEDLDIAAAMRRALALAQEEYVLPVDADDLLTPDALQVMACEIRRREEPEMLYSDEDLLVDGTPSTPFRRPDFDPVLHLEGSYIWHLCALRRDAALRAGLYSDAGATWCHDWDTVFRLFDAGGRIEHVPEILYHWRRHSSSSSNTAAPDSRSAQSVRHVLEARRAQLADAGRFQVQAFPRDRGGPELYLAFAGDAVPRYEVVLPDEPVALDLLLATGAEFVVILDPAVRADAAACIREAARLCALHREVALVGGRLVGGSGVVVESCWVRDRFGRAVSPLEGLRDDDPGPYALALKPHSVAGVSPRIAVLRASFLAAHRASLGASKDWAGCVEKACGLIRAERRRAVYSPLVEGVHVGVPPERARAYDLQKAPILGLAGYAGRHGIAPL